MIREAHVKRACIGACCAAPMQWLPRYRDHLLGQGLSPKTARIYIAKVERASSWCQSKGVHLTSLTPSEVAEMCKQFPYTASSRRQLRTALKHYWEMLGIQGPVKAIRVPPKPAPRWRGLEPEDAARLVKAAVGWHPQGTAVLFGMYLALRREEIATAQWSRFDEFYTWYTVTGKRGYTDTLPVHPVLRDQLRSVRMLTRGDWVFPGSRGRPHITDMTVTNWVQEVADAAGLGHFTPHQMRHTAIAMVNDSTGDLRTAMVFARHRRVESTQIYTRTTAEKLERAVETLDYLAI